ncbi:cAMP-dependent kinase catalytic subunit, partial [Brachionus plicatilis]
MIARLKIKLIKIATSTLNSAGSSSSSSASSFASSASHNQTNSQLSTNNQKQSKETDKQMGQSSSGSKPSPGFSNNPTTGFLTPEYEASVKQFLDFKRKEFEERYKHGPKSQSNQLLDPKNVKLDDFELDRTIGTGSFGRVIIVYLKKDRSQRYAMKMLKKENI